MKNTTPRRWQLWMLLAIALPLLQCKRPAETVETPPAETAPAFTIAKSDYGQTPDGQSVAQYKLTNASGMEVDVITYGGIITSWKAPDRNGKLANIALGFDNLAQYVTENPYFGAIIGRYGNRIAKGKFTLDGQTYQLETNDGPNHLHGGTKGFDKVVWAADTTVTDQGATLRLSYTSADGEGGYPGTLKAVVTYTLTADNALEVAYEATTDKTTIVNLTQHTYFNLSGDFKQTILDHELMMRAPQYLPVDATLIPTGELADVAQTPFDFTTPKTIGQDIAAKHVQLERGKGYDHCWILDAPGTMRHVASVVHPGTGRQLDILTDEPGLQFYCGNFLDGTLPMPGGGTYGHRTGFCLETQHYPDSPNRADFPTTTLAPGATYKSKTVFRLGVAK